MNQVNELPTNTIVPYDLVRGDLQEVPECGICLDTQKKVNCIGLDRMICHRAPPSERNPGNTLYHYFHKTCLGEWLITPHSGNKCPNCETILSNESIAQELALSPMEKGIGKGVQMAEHLLRRAAKGAFYGAWSWAAVYTLMGHQTDLGDFSESTIRSTTMHLTMLPWLAKGLRAPPDLSFLLCYVSVFPILGSLEYWLSLFQKTENAVRNGILQTCFSAIPLILSRDVMEAIRPELSDLEQKIYNWSWKAIPGLALGVASRMLSKWWGSS